MNAVGLSPLIGAGVYLVLAFAAGFCLGVLRTLAVEPAVGPVWAVAFEAPAILSACWFASWFACRVARIDATLSRRATMGAIWLVGIQAVELALAGPLRGWGPQDWLDHFFTPQGAVSLGLFVVAAAFPVLQRKRASAG